MKAPAYNLDDKQECEAFLKGHNHLSGVRLARALGLQGKGSVTSSRNLLNYARIISSAFMARQLGHITQALDLERLADSLYMRLPESLRW